MHIPSTTVEFLDALKDRRGFTSDYQLWKFLDWKQTTMSNYRTRGSAMSGAHAVRIADELALPRAYVLACMEAERERNDQVARVWRELAAMLRRSAAAVILISLGIGAFTRSAGAAELLALPGHAGATPDIYSVKSRRRRRHRAMLGFFSSFLETLAPAAAAA